MELTGLRAAVTGRRLTRPADGRESREPAADGDDRSTGGSSRRPCRRAVRERRPLARTPLSTLSIRRRRLGRRRCLERVAQPSRPRAIDR